MEKPDTETYCCTAEKHGRGTFFFTDCGNQMYSVSNDWKEYHENSVLGVVGFCIFAERMRRIRSLDPSNSIIREKFYLSDFFWTFP